MHTFEFTRPKDSAGAIRAASQTKTAQQGAPRTPVSSPAARP